LACVVNGLLGLPVRGAPAAAFLVTAAVLIEYLELFWRVRRWLPISILTRPA